MTIRYHVRGGRIIPDYVCQKAGIEHGMPSCRLVNGEELDLAIGELLVAAITPQALEMTLAVDEELRARVAESDRLRRQQVERARYEADLAQRRFLHVAKTPPLMGMNQRAGSHRKLRRHRP